MIYSCIEFINTPARVNHNGELGLGNQGVSNAIKKVVNFCARAVCNIVFLLDVGQHDLVCELVMLHMCCKSKALAWPVVLEMLNLILQLSCK